MYKSHTKITNLINQNYHIIILISTNYVKFKNFLKKSDKIKRKKNHQLYFLIEFKIKAQIVLILRVYRIFSEF